MIDLDLQYITALVGGMLSWYAFSVGITFYNKWLFLVRFD